MAHDEHHFVPAFLLREWQTGEDDKLTSLRWARGAVVANRYKAKSVAKRPHLYSTGMAEGLPNNKLEREFLGPKVDDPAAIAHQVMLKEGIEAPMARSNCSTDGHPNCSRQDGLNYALVTGVMAMRAAASLSL